jgi:hypothetical protein
VAESTRPKIYRFVDFADVNLLLNMAERELEVFTTLFMFENVSFFKSCYVTKLSFTETT